MDRFKFRVWYWNEAYQQWENRTRMADFITIDGSAEAYSNGEGGAESIGDNIIIEQCTGLKDKNGNLIYENDVLFDGEFCGQVIWKDGCLLVEMTLYDGDKSYEHLDQHFAKYGEIISNIHEQKDSK